MFYVFTCFQVCFKYVSSMFFICFTCFQVFSRVFKVFFKCFFVWAGAGPRRLGRWAAASAGCLPHPARRSRCGTSRTSRTTSRTGSRWRGPPSSPLWPPSRLKVAAPRVTLKILWKHVKHTWNWKHTRNIPSFVLGNWLSYFHFRCHNSYIYINNTKVE